MASQIITFKEKLERDLLVLRKKWAEVKAEWGRPGHAGDAKAAELTENTRRRVERLQANLASLQKVMSSSKLDISRSSPEYNDINTFIATASAEASGIQTELSAGPSARQSSGSAHQELMGDAYQWRGTKYQRMEHVIEQDNDRFIDGESKRQQMMIQEQDHGLDELSLQVDQLHGMSEAMRSELELHNRILDDLGTDMERTESRMKTAFRKVNDLLDKQSEGTSCFMIIVLIIILFVLVMAVVYV
mmetsp:Transcript_27765/g.69580  ORF Transcript_27765/g.69580 Transcript_27765/m.69580 type:complete len:246 (-) Transcript_27765:17-754(-)